LLFGGNGDSGGSELWTTDGTAVGTTKIKEIRSGTLGSYPNRFAMSEAGVAIFSANDGAGAKIWRTDGTPGGTVKIAAPSHSNPWDISFVTGGGVGFTATSSSGRETWFSDGTGGGTLQLADLCPGSCSSTFNGQNLTGVDGTIFINADDGTHGRAELFTTDGTPGGTVLIKDIQQVANESAEPAELTPMNLPVEGDVDVVFFRANDGASTSGTGGGRELWSSDGTPGGTDMVADIRPGQYGSQPYAMIPFGGLIYFTAWDPTWGREIWKSDGTEIGTERVADICPGDCGALWEEARLTEMGGMLYFPGDDDVNGTELWKSDGTGLGTSMVKNIGPTSDGGYPSDLTVVGSTLFFSAYTFAIPPEGGGAPYGTELWKSDGTDPGTVLVKDICPGVCGGVGGDGPVEGGGGGTVGGPQYTDLAGLLVFSANDGTSGAELWRSDGSQAGKMRVQDTAAGPANSNPLHLTAVGATLFYLADDGISGPELWMSDGTDGGTVLVKDIVSGAGGSTPAELTAIGDRLLFTADNGVDGRELWISDGTSPGTHIVADICPGACGSNPNFVAAEDRVVYFAADDGTTGREVWVSDGTAAGTVRVADIETAAASNPELFTVSGTSVFFRARRPSEGEELWFLEREVDLGLTMEDSADPALTGPLVYTVTVSHNAGSSIATNVTVVDTLPPEVDYVGFSGDGECDETGGVVTCHLGVMVSSEVNVVDIEVDIPAGVSGNLLNTAVVTSSALETNASDNQASETTKVYDIAELIFYDNFESGGLSAWSSVSP